MPYEIERKFLINDPQFVENLNNGKKILQGYLSLDADRIVRVRTKGDKAFLTIKSRQSGISRLEYEYEIPTTHAQEILENMCIRPLIEKTRYTYAYEGHEWEIDVFDGVFAGIIVAEIELNSEEETFEKPSWVGKEVTHEKSYNNGEMVKQKSGLFQNKY